MNSTHSSPSTIYAKVVFVQHDQCQATAWMMTSAWLSNSTRDMHMLLKHSGTQVETIHAMKRGLAYLHDYSKRIEDQHIPT